MVLFKVWLRVRTVAGCDVRGPSVARFFLGCYYWVLVWLLFSLLLWVLFWEGAVY